MSIIYNDQNFKQEVEQYSGLALIDFFADWCGPCRLMAPIIDEIAIEYKDKDIKIGKVNIDENKELVEKYRIMSVPTIYLFKQGKIIERINGYCIKEDLIELINKNL